jgi:hypothetical protein
MSEPVMEFGAYNGRPVSEVPLAHIARFFDWYENSSLKTQAAFKRDYDNLKAYCQKAR